MYIKDTKDTPENRRHIHSPDGYIHHKKNHTIRGLDLQDPKTMEVRGYVPYFWPYFLVIFLEI